MIRLRLEQIRLSRHYIRYHVMHSGGFHDSFRDSDSGCGDLYTYTTTGNRELLHSALLRAKIPKALVESVWYAAFGNVESFGFK